MFGLPRQQRCDPSRTLNVFAAGSFSESEEECSGCAVPGPARSEAKVVGKT